MREKRRLALGFAGRSEGVKRKGVGAWEPSHRGQGRRGTVLIASVQTKKRERIERSCGWWMMGFGKELDWKGKGWASFF
jgi:hypothetical protein